MGDSWIAHAQFIDYPCPWPLQKLSVDYPHIILISCFWTSELQLGTVPKNKVGLLRLAELSIFVSMLAQALFRNTIGNEVIHAVAMLKGALLTLSALGASGANALRAFGSIPLKLDGANCADPAAG